MLYMTIQRQHSGNRNWIQLTLIIILGVVIVFYWIAPVWVSVSGVLSEISNHNLVVLQKRIGTTDLDLYKKHFSVVSPVIFGRSSLFDTITIYSRQTGGSFVYHIAHNSIFLIGQIQQGGDVPDMRLVYLVSRPGESRLVRIEGVSDTVTAIGRGNGVLSVDLPTMIPVSAGAEVFDIATGYPIGYVRGIDGDPRDPLKTVFIALPINPRSLTVVGLNPV